LKLPRDLSGDELAHSLRALGYSIVRQTGSHLRLTSLEGGEHHLTIPRHARLKVGTIAAVLADVAGHHGLSRQQLRARLRL
jgi:predicted RNA binding protein YcfA (HicA-like mRNA interferase family)